MRIEKRISNACQQTILMKYYRKTLDGRLCSGDNVTNCAGDNGLTFEIERLSSEKVAL
jgi:hypothetical protein